MTARQSGQVGASTAAPILVGLGGKLRLSCAGLAAHDWAVDLGRSARLGGPGRLPARVFDAESDRWTTLIVTGPILFLRKKTEAPETTSGASVRPGSEKGREKRKRGKG